MGQLVFAVEQGVLLHLRVGEALGWIHAEGFEHLRDGLGVGVLHGRPAPTRWRELGGRGQGGGGGVIAACGGGGGVAGFLSSGFWLWCLATVGFALIGGQVAMGSL